MGMQGVDPSSEENDRLRSLTLAAQAFSMMRCHEIDATPAHYRVLYHYASASNGALRAEIDRALADGGVITAAGLEDMHARYFPNQDVRYFDEIGAGLASEIGLLRSLLTTNTSAANAFGNCLQIAASDIGNLEREAIGPLLISLLNATAQMHRQTSETVEQLKRHSSEIHALRQSLNAVRAESMTDGLTELHNRKQFDVLLAAAIDTAKAEQRPLALLLMDVDHFKSFNDRFGHLTGDQVLRLVARSIRRLTKGQDIAARFGGEEFAVILPNTQLQGAFALAESIRRDIAAQKLKKKSTGEQLSNVSISAGISALRMDDGCDSLIERADARLYEAKRLGRNRVVAENQDNGLAPLTNTVRAGARALASGR
jgi:diguanylate cyclase